MERQEIMDSEERNEDFVTASEQMLSEALSEVNSEDCKEESSNDHDSKQRVSVAEEAKEDSTNAETRVQSNSTEKETSIFPEEEDKTKVEFVVRLKGSIGEVPKPEECTLDEEPDNVITERNDLSNASWREDTTSDDFDEDEEDYSDDYDENYSDDDEDEEAAAEWLRRYYLRQRGLPEALASLPSTIKVSLVAETEEDRIRREEREREQIAKRREAYRKQMASNVARSMEKGKRKFGDRMNLEEASRDDFSNGQDYVDFLNSKLQNVSIKMTR